MKTESFQISLVVIALLFTSSIFAQANGSNGEKNVDYSYVDLSAIVPGISITGEAAATESVNEKVAKSFKKYFGDQAEENWSVVGTNFLNHFHANGILTSSMFDKKGNLIYTITYGGEQNMPADIKRNVKSEYYDYKITMAINVKENKRDIWVVTVEDEKQQITVRLEDGDMEQVRKIYLSK
jgi:hypothetical protein